MALTNEQLLSLLAPKASKKYGVPHAKDLTRAQAGYFESKVGTMRKSSKGRSYRMPNGFVRYRNEESEVPYYRA